MGFGKLLQVVAYTGLALSLTACSLFRPETERVPAAIESPQPAWTREDAASSSTPAPPAKPPQAEVAVLDPDSPEDARVRHKQALLEASEDSLSASEVGYYMDILEARLIQQVRSDSVSMSREGNTFILKLSGGDAFSSNRSRLKPDVHDALGSIARVLEEYRDTQISIYGHTDDAGEEAYNQKLSERRAQSVARYLIDGGLAANRIVIIGYGETRPSASNETAEGRALNRRIELRLEPLVQ